MLIILDLTLTLEGHNILKEIDIFKIRICPILKNESNHIYTRENAQYQPILIKREQTD